MDPFLLFLLLQHPRFSGKMRIHSWTNPREYGGYGGKMLRTDRREKKKFRRSLYPVLFIVPEKPINSGNKSIEFPGFATTRRDTLPDKRQKIPSLLSRPSLPSLLLLLRYVTRKECIQRDRRCHCAIARGPARTTAP